MLRSEIINHFIKKYKLKSYLEIGIHKRTDNFDLIKCREKFCIDPDPEAKADLVITSDEFFKINNRQFDIVFIDGLHEAHQVYKDIKNTLKFLKPGGVIICHDCNPKSAQTAKDFEEFNRSEDWNGDCWKGFVKYRYESEHECYVIDTDQGCGVIDTNNKTKLDGSTRIYIGELVYAVLEEYRTEFLDLRDESSL